MDLNYCTMVNRSNMYSILKKRKSSYKESVTVKLKRHSLKDDESGGTQSNEVGGVDGKTNDSMCLICRTRSECLTDKSCTSMAATVRGGQQQSRQENDIQNSQSCTNCVVKTSPTKLSVPSSPATTKWNALNQKSQSQWNATAAVSVSWCDSSSPTSGSTSSSSSSCSSSSMPSCQLQYASSSSSIPPTVSKTLSSSTITTKTLSSPTQQPQQPPPPPLSSLLLSLEAIDITFSSSSAATTTTTAAAAAVDSSSQLSTSSSSRTNATAATPSCSVSNTCISSSSTTSISTSNSTSTSSSTNTTSSTSLSGSSKKFANVFRSARLTNDSVLRTFAFAIDAFEECLNGMFGTRRQRKMPLEQPISDSRVTRLKSKQSNSPPQPIFSIMFMFSIFLFMISMLPTTADAEVRLQRNETVCKSRDIRNNPFELRNLTNCTVIEGFLLITLIDDRYNHSAYEQFSFPLLTEVTEFVLIYHVHGIRTLSTLFPNLSVIRGKELFEGFALVIYQNTHLEDVGLTSLTTIARGAIRIEKNPALCFVETIDWTQIAVNMTSDQHFFRDNKAKKECPLCPGELDKQNGGTDVTCPLIQGQRHCWNSRTCQKICPSTCKNNCNDDLQCCDNACIGGCAKKNLSSCTSCRHFAKMDVCMDKCPENFFSYLERRCVTAETCTNVIRNKLEGTKQELLIPFNGVCSVRCPPGHNKRNSTCVKCEGIKCKKQCEGGLIDSVGAAKLMHGCTHIVKKPLTISIKRGGRHLMEELEMGLSSIEQIDTYLKVHRTYGMVSLAFFKNLKRIKGEILESDKFALYVLENQDLDSVWGPNQTVKMDEGRVFFHFNPKLCYSVIDSLRPSLKNASLFDKNEVATDSNGSKGSCNTEVLNIIVEKISSVTAYVRITNPMKFEDDRAFIGYQYFHTEDPYRNVSIFGQRPCDDSWSSDDPSKEVNHLFTNLKPFTQYAYYVKTHTISSEPRNGQSPIMYFRTKPDQPKTVQNLMAVSNSSSEVIIHWLRPTITNGNLTKYVIKVRLDASNGQLDSRNYCNDPLKEAATGEVSIPTIVEQPGTGPVNNGSPDCKCEKNVTRKVGSNPQMEEAIYENIIDFENNIQNFVYVKQSNDSSDEAQRRRRRRALDFYDSLQEKVSPPSTLTTLITTTHKPKTEVYSKKDESGYPTQYIFEVDASTTELVLTKLKHFSDFTIWVQACRAFEEGAPTKNCSVGSITHARTQKLLDVDVIRNLKVDLEQSNTTGANLRVKWDPPERPNGLVVSYTIFYIAANSPDAVHEKRCITAPDYQQHFTNGYLLTGLSTGNYSVRVRANSLAGEGIKSEPYYIYIPPKGISWQMITFIIVGLIVIICIGIVTLICVRKKYFGPPSDLKIFPTVNPYYISMQYIPDEWEVPRDKIIQLGALGQGSFGMVYEGILKNFNSQEDTPCAIKTVNENATDRERLNFLKEASVMKQFNTHHVVRLLGVCSRGQPALVIMELMKNGDLKAYLRQHRPDAEPLAHGEPPMRPPTLSRILQIAIEIADGMAYLAAKKYVHRDLAARNCMVAADLTVKIGDFGMTRDIYETDYYRKGTKGLLPVRWMSPESLKDGVFSSASDVFSYGVVLWEMATLASQPYQGFSNDQVLRFVIDGGVMERPENCPDKLYKLMQKCWQHRPSARPSFMEIIRFLLDTADPKFHDVSFYHSTEAKDIIEQMHPEHDMDDVTTPLRVGEFDYKLNIDDNSSVEPHESPALDEEDDDEDDDNVQPHSPYSLGSANVFSSTPRGHFKQSPNIVMNQSNPSLSLPSTSAAAFAATIAAVTENTEYVQPDPSYEYNERDQLHEQDQSSHNNNDGNTNTANNPATPAKKANKNHASSLSSATSKYPNSLKRAVASTVQNVSNSLVPLRIPNMNFLHRRLFKNNSNVSSSGGSKGQRNSGTKSETSSKNGNNNNSNVGSITPNVETGSSYFFSALTPSHTSKNPNYQILDEIFNVSAIQDEQYPLEERLSPTKSQKTLPRNRTGSHSSGGSGSGSGKSNRNNGKKLIQQPHQTTDQCNLNRDNSNLSTSSNIKDTKSSQSQKQNQPINLSSAHELTSSSGVSSPISIKDNRNTSDASTVISTFTAPATKTSYQLKENWLRQFPQLPPNGFIGREG